MTHVLDPRRTWQRAKITGTIKILSPLHIGDGLSETFDERRKSQTLGKAAQEATRGENLYSSVCRDHRGRAMLPGSALRGLLRAELEAVDPAAAHDLFGPPSDRGSDLRMGRLRVCDAYFRSLGSTAFRVETRLHLAGTGWRR